MSSKNENFHRAREIGHGMSEARGEGGQEGRSHLWVVADGGAAVP